MIARSGVDYWWAGTCLSSSRLNRKGAHLCEPTLAHAGEARRAWEQKQEQARGREQEQAQEQEQELRQGEGCEATGQGRQAEARGDECKATGQWGQAEAQGGGCINGMVIVCWQKIPNSNENRCILPDFPPL